MKTDNNDVMANDDVDRVRRDVALEAAFACDIEQSCVDCVIFGSTGHVMALSAG